MILVLEKNIKDNHLDDLINILSEEGISYNLIGGLRKSIYVEDTNLDPSFLGDYPGIEKIYGDNDHFLLSSRDLKKEDTIIDIRGRKIGGGNFLNIGGPCSVESRESLLEIGKSIKESGGDILRGGTYKLRTSPYSFQGLKDEGLKILLEVGKELDIPLVSEIVDPRQIEEFMDLDLIQVGARNMKNYELLKELGKVDIPIILKRGMDSTIDEFLKSAEYILVGGNEKVILCERGIRTFEQRTRNTLDLSVVPILKDITHLPVIVDPSHGVGIRKYVKNLSYGASIVGADGLMIECHNDPDRALSDSMQQVSLEEYGKILRNVRKILDLNIYGD